MCVTASVAGVYGIFMLWCVLRSYLGKRALEKNGCIVSYDETYIRARAESLEYCIRAAIAESNLTRKRIIVEIERGSPTTDEEEFIARAMREKHGNIELRFI